MVPDRVQGLSTGGTLAPAVRLRDPFIELRVFPRPFHCLQGAIDLCARAIHGRDVLAHADVARAVGLAQEALHAGIVSACDCTGLPEARGGRLHTLQCTHLACFEAVALLDKRPGTTGGARGRPLCSVKTLVAGLACVRACRTLLIRKGVDGTGCALRAFGRGRVCPNGTRETEGGGAAAVRAWHALGAGRGSFAGIRPRVAREAHGRRRPRGAAGRTINTGALALCRECPGLARGAGRGIRHRVLACLAIKTRAGLRERVLAWRTEPAFGYAFPRIRTPAARHARLLCCVEILAIAAILTRSTAAASTRIGVILQASTRAIRACLGAEGGLVLALCTRSTRPRGLIAAIKSILTRGTAFARHTKACGNSSAALSVASCVTVVDALRTEPLFIAPASLSVFTHGAVTARCETGLRRVGLLVLSRGAVVALTRTLPTAVRTVIAGGTTFAF